MMKIRKCALSFLLTAVLLFQASLPAVAVSGVSSTEPQNASSASSMTYTSNPYFLVGNGGSLRGMLVESAYNTDYPAAPNATAAALNGQAEEITTFAAKYGYDSIFYPAAPGLCAMYPSRYLSSSPYFVEPGKKFTFSDPLKTLCEAAQAKHQRVCVVLDPFTIGSNLSAVGEDHPIRKNLDWVLEADGILYLNPAKLEVQQLIKNIITEILNKYPVSGVVLQLSDHSALEKAVPDYYEIIEGLFYQCYRVTKQQSSSVYFGVSVENTLIDSEDGRAFIENLAADSVDFVLPQMNVSVNTTDKNYMEYASQWQELLQGTKAQLFTMNLVQKLTAPTTGKVCFGDKMEINYQLYANVLNSINGSVLYSYKNLKFNSYPIANDLMTVPQAIGRGATLLEYHNPEGIVLSENESILFTQMSQYYVSGICNPEEPLLLNGKEIKKGDSYGGFGILLPVRNGINTFLFEQGSYSKKLVIVSASSAATERGISDIQPDSVFPQTNQAVTVGETITLSCIGPYGGTMEARFHNKTYPMVPQSLPEEQQIAGTPVIYSVTVPIEKQVTTRVTKLGKASYTLTYHDFTSKYRSAGEFYAVGSSSRLAVEVNSSLGRVYRNSQERQLWGNLQYGTRDYVTSVSGDYYGLASGGYIHKSDATILEGFIDIEKPIQNVGIQATNKGENFIFVGGSGVPYHTTYDPVSRILTLNLYNLSEMPISLAHLNSSLFQKISVERDVDKGILTVEFTMKDNKMLWGYHVALKDENLILQCKEQQTISSTEGKPLENIVFVLDPGHGGKDTGDIGLIGSFGPSEKDLNLALSYMLSRRLRELGATVHMTRSEDVSLPEEDRLLYNEFQDADFFLSLQTDAVPKNKDGNRFYGLQIYYNSELSTVLGEMMYRRLSNRLNLTPRSCTIDTDYIEQVPLAKPLIIQTGYTTNPTDYGRLSNPMEVYKLSCAISDTIIDYLKLTL